MVNDSPNNSLLTFSPLLTTKRVKDHFTTSPIASNSSHIANVNSTHGVNLHSNSTNTNPLEIVSNTESSSLNKLANTSYRSNFLSLNNSQIHQSSPQNSRILSDSKDIDKNLNVPEEESSINLTSNNDIKGSSNLNNDLSSIVEFNQPLTGADKLRLWRHDALLQHHYKTAIYIGDKILSLTNDPNDAFWLAQAHYNRGDYQIARNLLLGPNFENSVGCRYLVGLCLYNLDKLDEALDIIGEVNPFKKEHSVRNPDGGIKLESSICYLRGLIYNKQNNFERAKDCFKESVLVDVKCYEAFDALISNHLLTPEEEWELLDSLNFDDADNNNEFVKLLYTTHINKYKNLNIFEEARQRLINEYDLSDNIDILLSQAELYFTKCKFQKCLDLCSKIIDRDELNISALSNYLSCLYELGGKNKLFLLAHQLAENYPNHYLTWVAIGVYYFAIKQNADARMFFSKASIINPNFAPAWIGFAHTFASDGEHEQAISAYATASRLFPGTHLPTLFLGMQYLQMSNYTLSMEYLNYSYSICPSDPLLLNEIGVLNYHKNELDKAELYLKRAMVSCKNSEYGSKAWCSIHCNLAHVFRRMNFLDKAVRHLNEVLKIAKNDSSIYSTLGLIYLKQGRITNAIENLHTAITISPNDSIATDLLEKALDLNLKIANKKLLDKSLQESPRSVIATGKKFGDILNSLSNSRKTANNEIDEVDEIMDIESE
ncbi:hypothetical protein CANINC_001964 [Pichia inconspicua]|uniref:Uncharacterized protein n=1 Tax=Pichia inconspicua TaxID=52247 RepID=A0A4T0X2E6_9ASCO|nr:hypothetical protein CANINC_001964 [[Candida] inconspicua]